MNVDQVVVKRATPDEVEALGRLSDRVFRPDIEPGTGMPKEFPLMFGGDNAANLYYVEDAGRPVGLVGMMPGSVVTCGVRISVASMGSVCTDAAYRGRHFASAMIERVLADFAADTSVLLVSGGLSIYRRIGCVDFGAFYAAWLDASADASLFAPFSVRRVVPEEAAEALHSLYTAEPRRFARTPEQMRGLLRSLAAPHFRAAPHSPAVFAAEQDGRMVAYAIAALPNRANAPVHLIEWAGARDALFALAQAAKDGFGAPAARLYANRDDLTLRSLLRRAGVLMEEGSNQGTLRVLNPEMLLKEFGPALVERYGVIPSLRESAAQEWTVRWPQGAKQGEAVRDMTLRGFAELSAWFFGPDGLQIPLPRTDDLNYI